MDFSKLNGNEKLAVYGAIASVIGPILSSFGFGFGVGWLTLLLALGMLFIVFQPQIAPQTNLPGSKGSLMLVVGGIAALSAALALLSSLGWFGLFGANIIWGIGWLIGIVGGLLMGWAAWQEFQAEGGKFELGTSSTSASAPPAAPPAAPSAPAETAAPPAATTAAPAANPAPATPAEPAAAPEPPAAAPAEPMEPSAGDDEGGPAA